MVRLDFAFLPERCVRCKKIIWLKTYYWNVTEIWCNECKNKWDENYRQHYELYEDYLRRLEIKKNIEKQKTNRKKIYGGVS